MTQDTRRIGFLGLGAMGLPMATNLVRCGHVVRAFDVLPEAAARAVAGGCDMAGSPADAAEAADILAVMVATAEQVEDALFGPEGAVQQLRAGATVVLHSTVAPETVRQLAERLSIGGWLLLDAPVSGGKVGAESAMLTVMVSGSEAAFAAAEPLLEAIAGKVYPLGPTPGAASTVKMVNQLLAGVHIAAACEAMALGVRSGADPDMLFEIVGASAGSSWMFQNRVPHILARDFRPLSAVDIFVKDLGIVLDQGATLRFPLPVAAAARQMFLAAAAAGLGREDDSAVVKVYELLSGIEVRGGSR